MQAEVGSFPGIILHQPLPSLMHPQDTPTKPHQQSSQAELDTRQTGLEPSPAALSGSTICPRLWHQNIMQLKFPFEETLSKTKISLRYFL